MAGIPVLFSALRCLLIELNAGIFSGSLPRGPILAQLADAANDVQTILQNYAVPDDLARQLRQLLEVRHEIIHPAHQPGPEPHNTPAYLRSLRDDGLLQSTGKDADYTWISQLQSHRLFRWAFEVVSATVALLLREHDVSAFAEEGLNATYTRYRSIDAA